MPNRSISSKNFSMNYMFLIHVMNPAKRNVLDLKNETCKNREKRNVLKISHTRHFKTTKSSPKRAAFIVLNGKQTAFK